MVTFKEMREENLKKASGWGWDFSNEFWEKLIEIEQRIETLENKHCENCDCDMCE